MNKSKYKYEEDTRLWEYWNRVLNELSLQVLPAEVRSRDPAMDAIAVAFGYASMDPNQSLEEQERPVWSEYLTLVKLLRKMAFWILIQEEKVEVVSKFKKVSPRSVRRSLRDYYRDTQKIELLEYDQIYKSDLFHLMAITTIIPLNVFIYFPMAQGNLRYAYLNVWPLFRKNNNVISVNTIPRVDGYRNKIW